MTVSLCAVGKKVLNSPFAGENTPVWFAGAVVNGRFRIPWKGTAGGKSCSRSSLEGEESTAEYKQTEFEENDRLNVLTTVRKKKRGRQGPKQSGSGGGKRK